MNVVGPRRVSLLVALLALAVAGEPSAQVSVEEFLGFKHGLATEHVAGQWRLLVENGFEQRQDMLEAIHAGISMYFQRLRTSDGETFVALDDRMRVVSRSHPDPALTEFLPAFIEVVAGNEGHVVRIERPIDGYVVGTLVPGIEVWVLMVSRAD